MQFRYNSLWYKQNFGYDKHLIAVRQCVIGHNGNIVDTGWSYGEREKGKQKRKHKSRISFRETGTSAMIQTKKKFSMKSTLRFDFKVLNLHRTYSRWWLSLYMWLQILIFAAVSDSNLRFYPKISSIDFFPWRHKISTLYSDWPIKYLDFIRFPSICWCQWWHGLKLLITQTFPQIW